MGSSLLSSFHTPSSSGSGQSPDSGGQQKVGTVPSTPAAMVIPEAFEIPDVPLSELERQNQTYTSDFLDNGDVNMSMGSDFDTRDLMSTQEFDEFCTQFGFTGDMGMRFA